MPISGTQEISGQASTGRLFFEAKAAIPYISKKTIQTPTPKPNPAHQLRPQLAAKIASLIGNEENRITEIPNVSLHRRTVPSPPCRMTYHPGVIVVAQGSKRVNLGPTSFTYDESHFLVTAIDLPIVSWVAEASEKVPCLVLSVKLDMAMVRELLTRGGNSCCRSAI